jgi:hypothetical protein
MPHFQEFSRVAVDTTFASSMLLTLLIVFFSVYTRRFLACKERIFCLNLSLRGVCALRCFEVCALACGLTEACSSSSSDGLLETDSNCNVVSIIAFVRRTIYNLNNFIRCVAFIFLTCFKKKYVKHPIDLVLLI